MSGCVNYLVKAVSVGNPTAGKKRRELSPPALRSPEDSRQRKQILNPPEMRLRKI